MSFTYTKTGKGINLQAEDAVWVQATDATATIYSPAGQVYVGTGGTVVLITSDADATTNAVSVTFIGVQTGSVLPVLTQRVLATGTTATGLVILN
jgi:hypothetical protein